MYILTTDPPHGSTSSSLLQQVTVSVPPKLDSDWVTSPLHMATPFPSDQASALQVVARDAAGAADWYVRVHEREHESADVFEHGHGHGRAMRRPLVQAVRGLDDDSTLTGDVIQTPAQQRELQEQGSHNPNLAYRRLSYRRSHP